MWKYGRHPICDGEEKKLARRNPAQDENIMSASATQSGHNDNRTYICNTDTDCFTMVVAYGKPGSEAGTIKACRDKYKINTRWQRNDIPLPPLGRKRDRKNSALFND